MGRCITESTHLSSLNQLIKDINKKFGNNTLIFGSEISELTIPRCTTGSLAFDLMLGGGWPLNCWNEVIGQESSGKTAMVLKTIAANQALNPDHTTLWIASEEIVLPWMSALGVDLKRLLIAETQVMEEAYQIMVDALDTREVDAIVLDSYPALVAAGEDSKAMDEMTVGLGAKLTAQFMRKSNKAQRRSLVEDERPCLGIIINQWREKIGVMHGDPRTTPGGKAKNFSYFTRVEMARQDWIEVSGNKVGITTKAKTLKNKTAPPQRTGVVDFYFEDSGPFHRGEYDVIKEVTNIALSLDIIKRTGAYYLFGTEKWHGKDEVLAALRSEIDLQKQIDTEVRKLVLHAQHQ